MRQSTKRPLGDGLRKARESVTTDVLYGGPPPFCNRPDFLIALKHVSPRDECSSTHHNPPRQRSFEPCDLVTR